MRSAMPDRLTGPSVLALVGREVRRLNEASYDAKCVGCGYVEELCGRCFREMVERVYSYRDKKRADYDEGLAAVAKLMLM